MRVRKKYLHGDLHGVFMVHGPGKCMESIAMMIYYYLGTGCSLSSQYSLQESVLKIQMLCPLPNQPMSRVSVL